MPDLSSRPRGREIAATIEGLLDIYVDPNSDRDEEEHARHHVLWGDAFFAALEYMAEYPRQAAKLLTEYRQAVGYQPPRSLTDAGMAHITSRLFPMDTSKSGEKLLDLAKAYKPNHSELFRIKPELDDGKLVWQDVEQGKLIFPTWHEEYEDWEHTS